MRSIKIVVYGIIMVLLGSVWVAFDVVKVTSNSMFPTYKNGDYLLSLDTYWYSPKPNDVIVFKRMGKLIIKRIVPINKNTIYKYSQTSFSTIRKKQAENITEYHLPTKGQWIKGNEEIKKYDHFIKSETKKDLRVREGIYYLGIKKITEYHFKNNFYFVEGDNNEVSMDSKKFGVISEKDVVAKILCKLW